MHKHVEDDMHDESQAHGDKGKGLWGGRDRLLEKRVIKAQVHCGLERPRVFVRLNGWRETVPVYSHERDEAAYPVGGCRGVDTWQHKKAGMRASASSNRSTGRTPTLYL